MSTINKQLKRDYANLRLRFDRAPTRLPLLGLDDGSERRLLGRLKLRKRAQLEASKRP